MIKLEEKPIFEDGQRMHCDKKEGGHKCVRLEGHEGPGYTVTIDTVENVRVETWYEMEVHQ